MLALQPSLEPYVLQEKKLTNVYDESIHLTW